MGGGRWTGGARRLPWLVWGLVSVVMLGVSVSQAAPARRVVGVVTGGSAPSLEAFLTGVQRELATLAGPELELVLPEGKVRRGALTPEGMEAAFAAFEADGEVSLGVMLGYVASGVASQRRQWKKPVLATHLLARPSADVPGFDAIVVGPLIRTGLAQFFEAVEVAEVTVVVDEQARLILPQVEAFLDTVPPLQRKPWTLRTVPARPEAMLEAAGEGVGGVIFSPFPGLPQASMAEVAEGLMARKRPSYAMGGRGDVEAGLLFGSVPKGELRRLARRTALTLYSMAREESLGSARDEWAVEGTPVINVATAKAIGFSPRWELFRYAEKVGEVAPEPLTLSLGEAMERARLYNPGLASEARLVEARAQETKKVLANLLPRIDASVTGIRIDENSAEKSRGTESEETIKGSLTLTQVIYSEEALSGYSASKTFQLSREAEQEARELDKGLSAGQAYLTLLKARSLAAVREGNLGLTQENLERARARKQVGALNPSELFRWESEVARNRTELLNARVQVRFAENALKRLCGMRVAETVDTRGGEGDQAVLLTSHPGFREMLDRPTEFDALVATLVDLGWDASPELRQLDHALASGRRRVKGARRAFYLPEVALKGGVTEILDRHGYDRVFPSYDEREWHVAIQASFPLVTGGERLADLRQVAGETMALSLKRRHIMTILAEQITDAVDAVQASGATIGLAAASRDAAEKNLALVTDAYAEGAVAVITLLDAQNTTVSARIASDNAVYDHMAAMLRLQRLLGRLDFSGRAGEEMVTRLAGGER
ncbi:TolC family protein [Desulfoluna spongiiphila]|uniref:Outer membrane protein TolC n=1 Tax=Desulfoluna spongiiphila TaxID=419481 RepID=A0A1G5I8R8_9BACT|nr:TolC family protein [Desulfoluna spongiiphila]SCY72029.1 Outer membrane protein TolC [Desulfoluna spongiiphila]